MPTCHRVTDMESLFRRGASDICIMCAYKAMSVIYIYFYIIEVRSGLEVANGWFLSGVDWFKPVWSMLLLLFFFWDSDIHIFWNWPLNICLSYAVPHECSLWLGERERERGRSYYLDMIGSFTSSTISVSDTNVPEVDQEIIFDLFRFWYFERAVHAVKTEYIFCVCSNWQHVSTDK